MSMSSLSILSVSQTFPHPGQRFGNPYPVSLHLAPAIKKVMAGRESSDVVHLHEPFCDAVQRDT